MKLGTVVLFLLCALAAYVVYLDGAARRRADDLRRRRILALRARLRRQRALAVAAAATEPRAEPSVLAALGGYRDAFVYSGDWTALLELGDVYRKGAYPTHRPDPDVALRVYKAACGSPDPAVAGAAQTRFLECRADGLAAEDVAGAALPPDFAEVCVSRASQMMTYTSTRGRPTAPDPATREIAGIQPTVIFSVPPVVVTSDAQNVHDHSVTQGLKKALREMPARGDALEDVTMHVLESGASAGDKAHALEVLDTLNAEKHSTLGDSERAALDKVWARIQDLPTPDARRDAADILTSQLASGVERGSVVCSTGKIARIMSALDGLTPEGPVVRPMWAVREELGTLAARVRDRVDDPEAARAEFQRAATQTYVDDLGLSEELIGGIVSEYASGFM